MAPKAFAPSADLAPKEQKALELGEADRGSEDPAYAWSRVA